MKVVRCGSCRAEIVWCWSSNGLRIPVDAQPVAGGNLRLTELEGRPYAKVVGSTIDLFDPDDDGVRRVTHFVSCPDADEWRHR